MGTRADFYVGRGKDAEWLGSIAWDGHPGSIEPLILRAAYESELRAAVEQFLGGRDDATFPKDGWPWPWKDSRTTDYAYALDDGKVWASCFGSAWFDPQSDAEHPGEKGVEFPDMSARKNVVLSGKKSGLLVLSLGPDGLEIE
jgi:hypothetical protein